MEREPVSSSNVTSIGWENGTLEVEFFHGKVYRYDGVPESVFREALRASSVGAFLHQHVITMDNRKGRS